MSSNVVLKDNEKGAFFKGIIKGSVLSVSITIIAICVFAFLLRFIDINAGMITPINQAIKIISILFGSFVGLKKAKGKGLIAGFLIGIFYTIISFLIFSILNGSFCFDSSLIYDSLFGGIAGGIAGIVAVNLKTK